MITEKAGGAKKPVPPKSRFLFPPLHYSFVASKAFFILAPFLVLLLVSGTGFATCMDGTAENACSTLKPFYCLNGLLQLKASQCGCPSGQSANGETCIATTECSPIISGSQATISLMSQSGTTLEDKLVRVGDTFRQGDNDVTVKSITAEVKCSSCSGSPSLNNSVVVIQVQGPSTDNNPTDFTLRPTDRTPSFCGTLSGTVCSNQFYLKLPAGGVMVSASCTAPKCTTGQRTCSDLRTLLSCTDGLWSETEKCAGSKYCQPSGSSAACWELVTCTPGEWVCDGDTKRKMCNPSGTGYGSLQTCASGSKCVLGQCESQFCTGGVAFNSCSTVKPKYCLNGVFVDKASQCGCPTGYTVVGESCNAPSLDPGSSNDSDGAGLLTGGQTVTGSFKIPSGSANQSDNGKDGDEKANLVQGISIMGVAPLICLGSGILLAILLVILVFISFLVKGDGPGGNQPPPHWPPQPPPHQPPGYYPPQSHYPPQGGYYQHPQPRKPSPLDF